MTKKQGFRAIVFLVLVGMIVAFLSYLFVRGSAAGTTGRFRAFYNDEKKDSWDGVFLGSSVVERAWVAPMAWNDSGIALYCMSTDSQPMVLTTKILEEVQKKQDVDFVVIDIRGIRSTKDELKDFKIRRLTDNLRYSSKRTEILNTSFQYIEDYNKDKSILEEKMSFYFPLLKYHSRWNELDSKDFVKPDTHMKGVYEVTAFDTTPLPVPKLTTKSGGLKEGQLDILNEMIQYGKEHNLQLLFTSMPAPLRTKEQMQINQAFDIIEESGFPGINFNTKELYDTLEIDFATDYYDKTHVNSKGARKVTKYMTEYLTEHYDYKDKRGDKAYQSWDKAFEKYEDFYLEGWKNPPVK